MEIRRLEHKKRLQVYTDCAFLFQSKNLHRVAHANAYLMFFFASTSIIA